ncbi:MAG: hypothetical protein ACRC1J_03725 [Sandaracinobacteroides sp.]
MASRTDLAILPDQLQSWPLQSWPLQSWPLGPGADLEPDAWQPPVPDPVPHLGVVLVNYKGAGDTIECLESLMRSDIPIRIAVVDNASGDGSIERILGWAGGAADYQPPEGKLGRLSTPPLPKPVALVLLESAQAVVSAPGDPTLSVIRSDANLGFAGGNNLGIRHLLLDPAIEAVWLLNNDTVVEPSAARALLLTIRADKTHGMIGTQIRYYHRPETVQALGGMTFNILTGSNKGIHTNRPISPRFDGRQVARASECVLGASLTVTRAFVQTVGLMSEAYFLYFEEMDWARRNRDRFSIGFARGAIVYHKHGGSIGSSAKVGGRSAQSE